MQAIEVHEYRCRRCDQTWNPAESYSPEGSPVTLQEMGTSYGYRRAVRLDPVEAIEAGIEPAGPVCPCCGSRNVEAIRFTRVSTAEPKNPDVGTVCPIRDIPLDGPAVEAAPCLLQRCGWWDGGRCALVSIADHLEALACAAERGKS